MKWVIITLAIVGNTYLKHHFTSTSASTTIDCLRSGRLLELITQSWKLNKFAGPSSIAFTISNSESENEDIECPLDADQYFPCAETLPGEGI